MVYGGSPGIWVLLVLGAVDYLWGQYVFDCPCSDAIADRRVYTLAFVMMPCLFLVFFDTNWKLCLTTTSVTFSTRLIIRPVMLSMVWIVFSALDPKMTACYHEVVPCACSELELLSGCLLSEKELASLRRIITARCVLIGAFILAIAAVATAMALVRIPNCNVVLDKIADLDCMCGCMDSTESEKRKVAIQKLLALRPKLSKSTILILEEQGLLNVIHDRKTMTPDAITKLKSLLTIGEFEKL